MLRNYPHLDLKLKLGLNYQRHALQVVQEVVQQLEEEEGVALIMKEVLVDYYY